MRSITSALPTSEEGQRHEHKRPTSTVPATTPATEDRRLDRRETKTWRVDMTRGITAGALDLGMAIAFERGLSHKLALRADYRTRRRLDEERKGAV